MAAPIEEATPSGEPLEWHFSQVFGERAPGEEVQEADIISAVEFDHSGDFLATGDNGGRVVMFERVAARPLPTHPDARPPTPHHLNPYEYRYLTEFQSHDAEFDYLKSLEIEEKINRIRWLRRWRGSSGASVLTTNDKTIKLWKVYEKKLTCLSDFNLQNASSTLNRGGRPSPDKLAAAALAERPRAADVLRVPKVVSTETVLASKCRRVYSAAHTYHIHSVSLSADEETFLSADDLRINLWHLERADTSFNVVDIKPPSMDDLTEVITAADFSTVDPHIFAYASSKGSVRLADLRAAALCDRHAKLFEDRPAGGAGGGDGPAGTFFTEIISSINDVRFVPPNGTQLVTRDYMTVKLWDLRYEAAPVSVMPVQEPLRHRLSDLYESDALFDKFDLTCSGDGRYFATGSYSGFFRVLPAGGGGPAAGETLLEASRDPTRRRLAPVGGKLPSRFVGFGRSSSRARNLGAAAAGAGGAAAALASAEEAIATDLNFKISHLSWHPTSNVIATAASNSLYLFYGRDPRQSEW